MGGTNPRCSEADHSAAVSGSTITVTGTAAINVNTYNGGYETWPAEDSRDANQHVLLQLGDLTDLTIDWKADLTLTGVVNGNAGNEEGIQVIHFINGTFKLTGGKIDIQTTGTGWNHVIEGGSFATINVSGGTVKGPGDGLTADGGDNATPGTIIVSAGTVDFRNGVAINADSVTVSGGTINGLVSEIAAGREIFTVDVYGTTNSLKPFNIDDPQPILEFTVKSNATWTLSADVLDLRDAKDTFLIESNGTLILSGTGPLDNYGTVTIKEGGELINNSTINNFSGNTINNQGTLTNNGIIDKNAQCNNKRTKRSALQHNAHQACFPFLSFSDEIRLCYLNRLAV